MRTVLVWSSSAPSPFWFCNLCAFEKKKQKKKRTVWTDFHHRHQYVELSYSFLRLLDVSYSQHLHHNAAIWCHQCVKYQSLSFITHCIALLQNSATHFKSQCYNTNCSINTDMSIPFIIYMPRCLLAVTQEIMNPDESEMTL